MSIEAINIYVKDDTINHLPVAGVVVRIFDSTGTTFITQGISDDDGLVGLSLTAPSGYQARFFLEKFSIRQPQKFLTVVTPDPSGYNNNFSVIGHMFSPPEAVHPRLCRCSGFFRRPDSSPAINHTIHVIAKFDPILFQGDAMLTERLKDKTDPRGFVQFDLVRFAQYEVTVEGFEDQVRIITVPDAPSVNLPDLLFPVVSSIDFDPPGPWSIGIGAMNDRQVTPTVRTSDGRVLPGVALQDVLWMTSDPNSAVVLAGGDKLTLRGFVPGTFQLLALRADSSIIRIPNVGITGVPVDITVV